MSRVWRAEEVAILDKHLESGEPDWMPIVCVAIPERSVASIKTKMAKRRAELGMLDKRRTRRGSKDRPAAMVAAYKALREAGRSSLRLVAGEFGVTRQAVHFHVKRARVR